MLSRRGKAVLFALAVAAIVLRAPWLVTHPRFWAEEGALFFTFAREHGWLEALFARHIGYLSLYLNAATLAATRVSLEAAPAITTAFALAAQCAPVAIVLAGRSPLWRNARAQAIAIAAIVFASPSAEIWLTSTNSQFFLCLSSLLLLLEDPRLPPRALILRGVLLLVAGLTGPASCVLTPVFAVRALRERTRAARVETAVLAVCCAVQLAMIAGALRPGSESEGIRNRFKTPQVAVVGAVVAVKDVVQPFLGDSVAQAAAKRLVPILRDRGAQAVLAGVAGLLVFVAVLSLVLGGVPAEARMPLGGAIVLLVLVSGSLSMSDASPMVWPALGGRYFYACNAALLIGAAAAAGRAASSVRRVACGVLVACGLAIGVAEYRPTVRAGEHWPRWSDEIARWRSEPGYAPQIWPPGWRVSLGSP